MPLAAAAYYAENMSPRGLSVPPAILIMTEFSLLREVSRTPERFRRGEATQSHRKAI